MSTEDAPSTPAAPTIVLAHPRDLRPSCGTDYGDVEDWLALYERFSKHSRWDAKLRLLNVISYLTRTAQVWFENDEEDLTSWYVCKQKLRDLFGKPVSCQLAAKKDLASRAQMSKEPYITPIQGVLSLCRNVSSEMSQTDKVSHILRCLADDAFNLLYKDCTKVATNLDICRLFVQAKHRLLSQRFERLPDTAASLSCCDQATVR